VGVGEIPAERVGLPGILVTRVVKKTVEPDEARRRLKPTQVPFVDRLAAILDGSDPGEAFDPKPDAS